jgi:hypothetical protein
MILRRKHDRIRKQMAEPGAMGLNSLPQLARILIPEIQPRRLRRGKTMERDNIICDVRRACIFVPREIIFSMELFSLAV